MKIKNPYLRNLLFSVDDIPINPLVHVFLYTIIATGVCFTFFPISSGAYATTLYTATAAVFGGSGVSIWGAAALIVGIINVIAFMVRRAWLGQPAVFMGWAVWVFALWIFFLANPIQWFGGLAFALPNVLFWTWQFVMVGRYHKAFHDGIIPQERQHPLEKIWNKNARGNSKSRKSIAVKGRKGSRDLDSD